MARLMSDEGERCCAGGKNGICMEGFWEGDDGAALLPLLPSALRVLLPWCRIFIDLSFYFTRSMQIAKT